MSLTLLEATPVEAPGDKAAPASAKQQSHPPQRILVVEDDTVIRQIYSRVLIRSGYEVDAAEDGEAGWDVLHATRHDPDSYDLLITDHDMPKLSGVELVKKIRSARMTLPVILASGTVPSNTEWLQLAAILHKPFSMAQLVQTVQEVLQTASSGQGKMCESQGRDSRRLSARCKQGIGQSPLREGVSRL